MVTSQWSVDILNDNVLFSVKAQANIMEIFKLFDIFTVVLLVKYVYGHEICLIPFKS